MQNISAIVQSIQIDLQKLHDENLKGLANTLATNKASQQDFASQKMDLLNEKSQTKKDEKKLKIQQKLYKLDSWLSSVKKNIEQSLKNSRNQTQLKQDIKNRVVGILNTIDSSQTDILSNDQQGGGNVAPPSSASNTTEQALSATIAAKHTAMAVQSQSTLQDRQKSLFERSSNFVQKQLNALKKSKFFTTLFKITQPLVSMAIKGVASLFATPLGAMIAEKLTSLAFEAGQNAILNGYAKTIKTAQKNENAVQEEINSNQKVVSQQTKQAEQAEQKYKAIQQSLEAS